MLATAAVLSTPYLWPAEPMWLKYALTGVFVLITAWIMIEQNKSASIDGSFWGPRRVPITRRRAVRVALFWLIAIALPPLFFFWILK
jgi:hypothetical protein